MDQDVPFFVSWGFCRCDWLASPSSGGLTHSSLWSWAGAAGPPAMPQCFLNWSRLGWGGNLHHESSTPWTQPSLSGQPLRGCSRPVDEPGKEGNKEATSK